MDKNILEKYKNYEDKILLSKILDKSKFCLEKNKIETTDFLDLAQKQLVIKFLNLQKITNYIFYGGFEDAERTMLVFYPVKIENIIKENKFDFNTMISVIRISLPNELNGTYEHRNYLGALIKLGIKREKIGDIIVNNDGADIIIHPEIEKFVLANLTQLTRFSKSNIDKIKLKDIRKVDTQKEKMTIIVSSMRLDNIVSELAKCSRNKANEFINGERTFINFEVYTKNSKEVKENDIITIRGKGRFKIVKIIGNTKKGKFMVEVEH